MFDERAELRRIGWTSEDEQHWSWNAPPARVVINHGSVCEVLDPAAGDEPRTVSVAGTLDRTPVAGDWVLVDDGRIREVAHRRTALSRPGAAGHAPQVMGANIDTVLLVVPLEGGLNTGMVERLSVMGWDSGAQPVLVLSKSDTTDDGGAARAAEAEQLSPGVPVVPISTRTGDGLEQLRAHLGTGTTTVMLGPSGAGKTSLLNELEGTHEPVAALGRVGGRHTTTTRRLHRLAAGGVLLDIPGIRSLELSASQEAVEDVFADVARFAAECRYGDCRHSGDGGCAVEEAVADGRLPAARLSGWRKLQGEIDYRRRRNDPAAMAEVRQQWKAVSKQARRNR